MAVNMNLDRVAYTLDLVADGYLLHSERTHIPSSDRAYFICAALDHARANGEITDADRSHTYLWLHLLGMRGPWPYKDIAPGFYRIGSQDDIKQSVRWTWLKFAAYLARCEACAARRQARFSSLHNS